MKISLLIWLCSISIICTANPITQEKAKEISEKFMSWRSPRTRSSGMSSLIIKHVYRSKATNNALCYVFVRSHGSGFVIASADDSTAPILGYSDTEIFDSENMAPATRWWLENYQKQIEHASKYGLNRRTRVVDTRQDIAPMIETRWNQEYPYNTLCPYDNKSGKRSLTGCVATATAQLMYYHKWPKRGTGSHSYEWNGKTLTADFGSTHYQWDKMRATYDSGDDTDNAIATLMYNCGVALEMKYGGWGSWAYFNNGEVMSKYFGYSPYYTLLARDDVGNDAFETALYNDLACGLPVLYGGQDHNRNEGHQFICDGYKEGGYYHMNWGWGGWNDGYFLLSALNTSDDRQWNWEQVIFCGIKKYEKKTQIDGLIFEDSGSESVTLTGGKPSGNFVVPSNVQFNGRLCKVTAIGKEAFRNNTDITSLTIPTSIGNIGEMAFRGCANLKEITIEDKSEYILSFENNVFEDCNIEKVYVGRNLANTPLRGMKSLKTVELGNGVTTLNDFELFGTGIKMVSIPSQIEMIGKGALGDCLSLLGVGVDKNNSKYSSEDGVLYDKGKTTLLFLPYNSRISYFEIPESVIKINSRSIDSKNIEAIVIPANIQTIEADAILCSRLKRVYMNNPIPPSVNENCFSASLFYVTSPTLYVPAGSFELYKKAKCWSRFPRIMELDYVGIESIFFDTKNSCKTYSIDGKNLPIKDASPNKIPTGIYIINGHKVIVKH